MLNITEIQSLIYVDEPRISVNVFISYTNSITNITNVILEFTETPCPIHIDCLNLFKNLCILYQNTCLDDTGEVIGEVRPKRFQL